MSLGIIPLFLWSLLVFLLPGFAFSMWLASRQALRSIHAIILLFVCGGALGYLAFWINFANKAAGKSFSFFVIGLSLLLLARSWKNSGPKRLGRELAPPLIYLAVIGACYLSLLYVVADPFGSGQNLMDWRFFTAERPGDNIIPWIFADKISQRQPLVPFCCGGWLSSDRPPLQAGIVLFFWPLKLSRKALLEYQLLGSALQCSWICGVWALLKALRASNRRIMQVLGLLVPSAFLFYNSVYTWPKLLAATYALFAIAILITGFAERRSLTLNECLLCASCAGLMLMAHPGSVFSMPVFALILAVKRDLPWRGLACGALLVLCFAAPWALYQKYVDPPGNRLLKMHLAGVLLIDSRSTLQAIRDSYRTLPWRGVALYKWKNVLQLVGPDPVAGFGLNAFHPGLARPCISIDPTALEHARIAQRDYIWSAIGILNAGWLAAGFVWSKRRALAIRGAGWLLLAGMANLIGWSLLMFGPAQTLTAHSSYADILLIMIGLSGFLLALPRWIPVLVVLGETANVAFVWMTFRPVIPDFHIQWPLAVFATLSALGILFYTIRAFYGDAGEERSDELA